MKLGIIGSRQAKALGYDDIRENIPDNCTMIISGGAVGVDTMAEIVAKQMNINFKKILPDYKIFGRTAPLVRNSEIVKQSDKIIAFWDHKSTGTAHAIRECIRLNKPVEIISIK